MNWPDVGLYLGLAAMILGTIVALVKHLKPPSRDLELERKLTKMANDIKDTAIRCDHVEAKADSALSGIADVKAMLKAHSEVVRQDFNDMRKDMHTNHSQVINLILRIKTTGDLA